MGFFDRLFASTNSSSKNNDDGYITRGLIDYGNPKIGGGHDHRSNKGSDRTPAQRDGDKKRRK